MPATREAPKGSRESTRAIKVSRGLYQSIMTSAPAKPASSIMRVKILAR